MGGWMEKVTKKIAMHSVHIGCGAWGLNLSNQFTTSLFLKFPYKIIALMCCTWLFSISSLCHHAATTALSSFLSAAMAMCVYCIYMCRERTYSFFSQMQCGVRRKWKMLHVYLFIYLSIYFALYAWMWCVSFIHLLMLDEFLHTFEEDGKMTTTTHTEKHWHQP